MMKKMWEGDDRMAAVQGGLPDALSTVREAPGVSIEMKISEGANEGVD